MKVQIPRDGKRRRRVVLVTGGRFYRDENRLFEILDTALQQCEELGVRLVIVQGGATGADRIACLWSHYQDGTVDCITERADWKRHGKGAGPVRNQVMLDKHKPDYYIAMPGGRGTDDMVKRCKIAKIPGADFRGLVSQS